MGRPHDIDLDLQLQDWLFALEGAEGVAEGPSCTEDSVLTREQKCWHTTFRLLKISASGRKLDSEDSPLPTEGSSLRSPVQNIKVSKPGRCKFSCQSEQMFGSAQRTQPYIWVGFQPVDIP